MCSGTAFSGSRPCAQTASSDLLLATNPNAMHTLEPYYSRTAWLGWYLELKSPDTSEAVAYRFTPLQHRSAGVGGGGDYFTFSPSSSRLSRCWVDILHLHSQSSVRAQKKCRRAPSAAGVVRSCLVPTVENHNQHCHASWDSNATLAKEIAQGDNELLRQPSLGDNSSDTFPPRERRLSESRLAGEKGRGGRSFVVFLPATISLFGALQTMD